MIRSLVFDPFAGISGDMILAALLDLGLSDEWLRAFVGSLGFDGVSVRTERVRRHGIDCVHVAFETSPEHSHRHLRHIVEIVDRTEASAQVKALAQEAFRRIAVAEAEVHGVSVDQVHFHEVGALDAILDVTCVMAAVRELEFDAFHTRPVAVGHGWIEIEHGRYPVPAPATLKLLAGIEITGHELEGECTTPTGAAILATLTAGKPPPPVVVVEAVGFGAGTRDAPDRPNCLRLVACEVAAAGTGERLQLLQADVDDMSPEYLPAALEALLDAGALDAVVVPISMKKGRPGARLEALVPEAALAAVLGALFRSTSTIGVRHWPVSRPQLAREFDTIEFRGQRIRLKRVRLPNGETRSKPEYDDVARAAHALGLTPYEVRNAIGEASARAAMDARPDSEDPV